MDADTDIIPTSPVPSLSTLDAGVRGLNLPPLPTVPGIMVPSRPGTSSRAPAQQTRSLRTRRTNSNSQTSRSGSLADWVSQSASNSQRSPIEVGSSPRQDVISVDDNSNDDDGNDDDDVIIESEGEIEVVTINENSDSHETYVELDSPGTDYDDVTTEDESERDENSRNSFQSSSYRSNTPSYNSWQTYGPSENSQSSYHVSEGSNNSIDSRGSNNSNHSSNADNYRSNSLGSNASSRQGANSETRNFAAVSGLGLSISTSSTASTSVSISASGSTSVSIRTSGSTSVPVAGTSSSTSEAIPSTSDSTSLPHPSTSVQIIPSVSSSSESGPSTSVISTSSVTSEQPSTSGVVIIPSVTSSEQNPSTSVTSVTNISPSVTQGTPSTSGVVIISPSEPDASAYVQVSTMDQGPSTSVTANPASHAVRLSGRHNDSMSEFRSPKRKRVASPDKKTTETTEDEEEGESCPICFEPWTTSGNHRLCCLKCGHLFGQSCIEKWLKGQGGKCPHCNAKAKRQDIRVLFAKSIKALDTSERDRALKDLEKEKELRRKVEMETAQLRLQYQMSIEDTNKLRLELERLKSQVRKSGQTPTTGNPGQVKAESMPRNSQLSGQFVLEKTIKIWEGGNCRVMAYSSSLATLVVTQPSSSQLFPGFGVKKISTLDFKTSQYLTIHTKAIRDMAFHQTVEDGILLSCGLDKKVKMTSMISNSVVQTYDTPMPGWSCAWNASDCNYFYTGLQNGLVLMFDVRNTGEPVQEYNKEGSRSPVASLVYVAPNQQTDFRSGGLLIGQLDRVSFLENNQQGDRIHILPLEGSLTSLNVDQETRHMLASYRPTSKHPMIRHQLCELTSTNISTDPSVINNVCSCNVVHTFHGGRKQTVLSKTLIQKHPSDRNRLLVCGGDETSNSVHIWDAGTGQLTQKLFADGMVVDLCRFKLYNQNFLAALTDKQCKIYKWQ